MQQDNSKHLFISLCRLNLPMTIVNFITVKLDKSKNAVSAFQTTFFKLEKSIKKLADDQCSSIT